MRKWNGCSWNSRRLENLPRRLQTRLHKFASKDWVTKPVRPYRSFIDEKEAERLQVFWERKHAVAATRTGAQNNLLDPLRVLRQLVFDELDDTVTGSIPLSKGTADVIRNDATVYVRSYLDTSRSIKNQEGICKTTYLPNILRRLEDDYSSVLRPGKNDWMARIFVTAVLRNASGSNHDDDDKTPCGVGGDQDSGGTLALKEAPKRKGGIDGVKRLNEKRKRVESFDGEQGSGGHALSSGTMVPVIGNRNGKKSTAMVCHFFLTSK
ncbi:hypothetical protein BT69DRAFT_233990 [Atractiella rhizophila]|nr:hypothetical protein BT69DRAFT_233990 [Atractiella rhizophila]